MLNALQNIGWQFIYPDMMMKIRVTRTLSRLQYIQLGMRWIFMHINASVKLEYVPIIFFE